ncbi:6160_t:CDS:1, partial [Cetraspora pellucida]
KQQQINKLAQEITEKDVKVEKTSDFSSLQNEVDNVIDGIDENTTDEKEKVKLAQAKELKELVESVKKDEDLASKNYFAS